VKAVKERVRKRDAGDEDWDDLGYSWECSAWWIGEPGDGAFVVEEP